MLIEEALNHLLQSQAGGKVYPGAAGLNAVPPYIIYNQIGGTGLETLQGAAGMETPIFQIDVYDTTFAGVAQIADAVKRTFRNFSGVVTVGEAGIDIKHIHWQSQRSGQDRTTEPLLYRITQDYRISYIDPFKE